MPAELSKEQREILQRTAPVDEPADFQALLADAKPRMDVVVKEVQEPDQPVSTTLTELRDLAIAVNLYKGEHLHESVRAPELSYVVRSFATIYMLVVVFDRPFDELRAERSVTHALPTIERLVLALPPMDPDPPVAGAGVMRMRRR